MPEWWRELIEGLRQEPAYLLIFGVCALFFLTGIGSAVGAVINKGDFAFLLTAVGCFGLALFGAIVVVFRVVPPHAPRALNIPKPLSAALSGISDNVAAAAKLDNEILKDTMLQVLAALRSESADWAAGRLCVRGNASRQILLQLYRVASKNVFATTVPEYHAAVWSKPFGQALLQSNMESRAPTTRIFLFKSRSELTQIHLDTMELQSEAGIKVLGYFDDEYQAFNLDELEERDFTLIDDGAAIGVTKSFSAEEPESFWYFSDDNRVQRFVGLRDSLIRGSRDLRDIKAAWIKQGDRASTSPISDDPSHARLRDQSTIQVPPSKSMN